MSDELLPYYEKELAFIRQMGAEFSKENPKVAGRLGIGAETVEDPHVSRMLEGFAYLNARIQHKLDDDFPELSDAMLNVLFPHFQRPIPSMSIVQFVADKEQLDGLYKLPKGTEVETEYFQGENCRFTTSYDVDLLPLEVSEASLIGRPFVTPGAAQMSHCASVLKLSLSTFTEDINLAELKPDRLRFYLKGQPQHIHPLYHLLLAESKKIVLARSEDDSQPVFLDSSNIKQVGFSNEEGMLPYPANSFLGYRLLTEYFVFPEKFMFVDICGLADKIPADTNSNLELYIYLNDTNIELEHNINADNFVLGASPVVNLFEHRADPIKLDHTRSEYQIIPDSRRPIGYEVYSVDKVTASTSAGEKTEFQAFYGLKHQHQNSSEHAYWYAARRPAKLGYGERDEGTDVFVSLVDLEFNPNIPHDRTISIESKCSNRDLPSKLPYNTEQPKLQCSNSAPPCSRIHCLTKPSNSVRAPLRNRARWRLLSHLKLNHLSLTGGDDACEALKEILRLYDFKETSVTRGLIESIISVDTRAISAPLPINGHTTMCRGIEIEITLDGIMLTGSSNYLYASVLEHFFSAYCSINSFSRVLVKLKNKDNYLKKCPPRAGEKILL
ncbi:type VI secretion system protein ImpG [Alteromonadaceae bacterium Bs31]|nr:type VI secretion system protein ImpG [Alteromonadaceae bacterium Bs31]